MRHEGLKLNCAYSWNCPPAKEFGISRILFNFALGEKGDPEQIKEIIQKLRPCKILELIARKNHSTDHLTDKAVALQYWRGGIFSSEDFSLCHNFNVIKPLTCVPLDKISLKEVNECFVMDGRIAQKIRGGFVIRCRPIVKTATGLALGKAAKKKITNRLHLKAEKGDFVSFHFSNAAEILSACEARILADVTEKTILNFNAKRN